MLDKIKDGIRDAIENIAEDEQLPVFLFGMFIGVCFGMILLGVLGGA